MGRRTQGAPALILDFGLLSNVECVIDFYAEIPHRAFQFGMPQQELDRSKVVSPAIDQRCFRSAHRVRSVGLWIKADGFDPGFHKPRILPGRQVLASTHSAWEQKTGMCLKRLLEELRT